ncbi:MAG: glutamate synthase subunit beta [Candidatus Omnitrophota bacterium]|jgi:glutamate synthase (NADPH/NADH) small chain
MMGDIRGFLKTQRKNSDYRPVCERVKDFKHVQQISSDEKAQEQASRCMDCATPFCHWGCPIGNYIPEWNDYMFRGNWKEALVLLEATNNMPEITGRTCPAPCEYACVLGINNDAVNIHENELSLIEHAFENNLIKPISPPRRSGKKIAIVGSGPAGLSCAAQLNKAGHSVVVFERDKKVGGILRYGIPDFKLEKNIIDRRVNLWEKEGIVFKTSTEVGGNYSFKKLISEFDATCLTGGSRMPRDLDIEGRGLKEIYFAMDYLTQANKRVSGEDIDKAEFIDAKDKRVVVIGGGDTGADCVGTAHRQGASCVVQIEVMSKPSECRSNNYPWPMYPLLLKTTTSHEEGGQRHWAILTKRFIGEKGNVKKLLCKRVDFQKDDKKACSVIHEIDGSEFEIEADMVIVAIGFMHPEHSQLLCDLNVKFDKRGNVNTGEDFMTSVKGIFSAGDMRRGQSLIVWAISEGRRSAYYIDKYLMGESNLPII